MGNLMLLEVPVALRLTKSGSPLLRSAPLARTAMPGVHIHPGDTAGVAALEDAEQRYPAQRYDREQPTISAVVIATQRAVVVGMCARIVHLLCPRVCYYHCCSCCQAR